MNPEDERLGRLLRLIRGRAGHTQIQVAAAAHVPLRDLKHVEAGKAGEVRLSRIRSLFEAMDGRAQLVPWWNGAAADRLLDERHAALVERGVTLLMARNWDPHVEVSFSEYGERGSIDIFAAHQTMRAVAICEVKSVIGSLEDLNRILDVKERLAPTIAYKRLGWRPRVAGRILILPRDTSVRRAINSHGVTMRSLYPGGSREVRAWLRQPTTQLRAMWFVSDRPNASTIPT